MSSFFGLTALGPPSLFAISQKRHCLACLQEPKKLFTDFAVSQYVDAFQERASSANETHQIRRTLIPDIIEKVLGRKLEVKENEYIVRYEQAPVPGVNRPDLFAASNNFRHFKLGQGNISLKEFGDSIQSLKEAYAEADGKCSSRECCVPEIPKRISQLEILRLKEKHKRDEHGPKDVLQYPITDNQGYGWQEQTEATHQPYFPRRKMDVTKNEGICLDNYYPTR